MIKLFVEGGGDRKDLLNECRQGFTELLKKANVKNKPRIVACGTRHNAFDKFKTAVENGEKAYLLVDSEAPLKQKPWAHLLQRDKWEKPKNVSDEHCFLMVEVMENWFLADHKTLSDFYGQGFNLEKLPPPENAVLQSKNNVYQHLKTATKDTKTKGEYGKGAHSFKILALLNPASLTCPEANRFITSMKAL